MFDPLLKALGPDPGITVIRYQDETAFGDYVESVASRFPSEGNIVIVAESFSGPIALALLDRYPTRIKCAVLSATFATTPFRTLVTIARHIPTFFFKARALKFKVIQAYCLNQQPDPELLELIRQVSHSFPQTKMKARFKVLSEIDMRPILPNIHTPILYLQGMQDRVVKPGLTQQLIDGLENIEVKKIDGPHTLLQSCPQECAIEIRKFISKCE